LQKHEGLPAPPFAHHANVRLVLAGPGSTPSRSMKSSSNASALGVGMGCNDTTKSEFASPSSARISSSDA
jgi:hypothetical protein